MTFTVVKFDEKLVFFIDEPLMQCSAFTILEKNRLFAEAATKEFLLKSDWNYVPQEGFHQTTTVNNIMISVSILGKFLIFDFEKRIQKNQKIKKRNLKNFVHTKEFLLKSDCNYVPQEGYHQTTTVNNTMISVVGYLILGIQN